ncbi:superoxide dismutase [Halobiforma nitratireducens]|uniref:superoxide dismutase n=1 Tax=Halobiforma nitratireducens JCM 10879 TaxID=1227454 RepID=M0LBE9_9EURY|nr:superoxide dismutase [Halobiforma nitratireducens]EMA30901.1 superoxide dismutase [Halobiforma nitratireducens JCM 10879]
MSDERSATRRRHVLGTIGGGLGLALLGSSGVSGAATDRVVDAAADDRRYRLPDLPYEYGALEPHIDERIMELHHGEHHQAYVDGANEALEEFDTRRATDDFAEIRAPKREFSFNYSGHVNHTIFWENLGPDGGGTPEGEFATAIDERFGSFETFQLEFSATADQVEGDGWAMLFYEPLADTLVIGQLEDQHELAHQAAVPILTLDVWEHAYYLQYENDREAYVEAWWNVVDWADVARRYDFVTDHLAGIEPAGERLDDHALEPEPDRQAHESAEKRKSDGPP